MDTNNKLIETLKYILRFALFVSLESTVSIEPNNSIGISEQEYCAGIPESQRFCRTAKYIIIFTVLLELIIVVGLITDNIIYSHQSATNNLPLSLINNSPVTNESAELVNISSDAPDITEQSEKILFALEETKTLSIDSPEKEGLATEDILGNSNIEADCQIANSSDASQDEILLLNRSSEFQYSNNIGLDFGTPADKNSGPNNSCDPEHSNSIELSEDKADGFMIDITSWPLTSVLLRPNSSVAKKINISSEKQYINDNLSISNDILPESVENSIVGNEIEIESIDQYSFRSRSQSSSSSKYDNKPPNLSFYNNPHNNNHNYYNDYNGDSWNHWHKNNMQSEKKQKNTTTYIKQSQSDDVLSPENSTDTKEDCKNDEINYLEDIIQETLKKVSQQSIDFDNSRADNELPIASVIDYTAEPYNSQSVEEFKDDPDLELLYDNNQIKCLETYRYNLASLKVIHEYQGPISGELNIYKDMGSGSGYPDKAIGFAAISRDNIAIIYASNLFISDKKVSKKDCNSSGESRDLFKESPHAGIAIFTVELTAPLRKQIIDMLKELNASSKALNKNSGVKAIIIPIGNDNYTLHLKDNAIKVNEYVGTILAFRN